MTGRLRVLQVVTGLNVYGAERVALTLASAVASAGDISAVLTITTAADNALALAMQKTLRARGVRVIAGAPNFAPRRLQMLAAAWRFHRLARRGDYDVIHVHADIAELVVALGRSSKTRGVRTLHNTELWPGRPGVAAFVERRLAAFTPVAISNGALQAWRQLCARSGLVSRQQAEFIRNAASVRPEEALSRSEARRMLDIDADEVALAFVGRLAPQKGFDVLVQAVSSPKWPANVSLHICGDGPLRNAVTAAQKAGAPIRWHGVVNDVSRLYRAFDGLLAPSRFEGATPIAALDAIVLNLPVAATRCPGIADDPTSDAMIRIAALTPEAICDAAVTLVGMAGDGAQTPVRDLSVEAMVEPYLALYHRLQSGLKPN